MRNQAVCAGVDWAKDDHAVLVADEDGERLWGATVTHDEAGIADLCRRLVSSRVQRVAIERPDGLLVERLLDAGLTVLAIHPNQVKAARDRFRPAGGKSDRFDAFVLCELARTDSHRVRALTPDSDQTKALRALTRGREVLVEQRVALCNQLRAELERFWPGASEIFTDLDSPISLAFLERYPSRSTRAGSARNALRSSSLATITADASTPASCWRACATPQRGAPRSSKQTPAADSCSHSSQRSNRSWSRSVCSPRRSRMPSTATLTARSSSRSSRTRRA